MYNSTNVLENKQSIFKKALIGASVAVMCLGFGLNASAASDDQKVLNNEVKVLIDSGGLSLETSSIKNFDKITLDGKKTYVTNFNDEFIVKDLRGTHAGWDLSVSASPFTSSDHALPKGSLVLDDALSIEGDAQTKPAKSFTKTAIDSGSVSVVKAAQGKGMGTFNIGFEGDSLELAIDPATAKAGDYSSTLTWTLATTPQG